MIAELDWCVGQMLDTLERLGLAENTIVIFSSDNGPVLDDGYEDQAVELSAGHRPAGPLRGGKYSLFDGGTRVPLLISWKGHIEPGRTDAKVCQVDFFASFAALLGQPLAPDVAVDSLNVLPALLGQDPWAERNSFLKEPGARLCCIKENGCLFLPTRARCAQIHRDRIRQRTVSATVQPQCRYRSTGKPGAFASGSS